MNTVTELEKDAGGVSTIKTKIVRTTNSTQKGTLS